MKTGDKDYEDYQNQGKPCSVERPTVDTAPMTEATGKSILAKLDEISESLMALMISVMAMEEQAQVDRHE